MAEMALFAVLSTETVTATMAFTAISQAGMVMSVVGAITGDKELSKIGGTMALVGGVGGLAAGAAGVAGSAASSGLDAVATEAASQTGQDALAASLDQSPAAMSGMSPTADSGANSITSASAGISDVALQAPQTHVNATPATAPVTPNVAATSGIDPNATNSVVSDPGSATYTTAGTNHAATTGINTPAGGTGTMTNGTQAGAQGRLPTKPAGDKQSSGTFFDWLSGLEDGTKLNFGGQLLTGAAKGYEADRNYSLGKDRLGLIQQQMANGNSAARYNFKA